MHTVPAEVFREYDIRGIADRDLTPSFAELLGRTVGTYVKRGGGRSLVVGRDCRPSGVFLGEALIKGIRSTGCDVFDIGVVTTPMSYWYVQHMQADGGVQITGSHNPPEYNGFKLTLLGASLFGQDIQVLRGMTEQGDWVSGEGALQHKEILQPYLQDLLSRLHKPGRTLKVVVDAGNGTGALSALPLYRALGHEVVALYCDMDGQFPNHHPDPTVEKNLVDLQRAVLEHGADVGIAFDGDADRIGVVDNKGTVLWGDMLTVVLSRAVLKEQPGATIMGEVKCSKVLYDDVAKHGGNALMWRTGHSLIKAKMKETGTALAGEMSGHIFFKHRYYGFDDAAYAGGRLLEILGASNMSLDALCADIPHTYNTPEIRFDCAESIKFELVRRVTDMFKQGASEGDYRVIDIDGARVEWADGWGLVRCSNTQPLLVLRFEALSQERLDAIQALFEKEIVRIQRTLM